MRRLRMTVVLGLFAWALIVGAVRTCGQADTGGKQAEAVELTNGKTTGSFEVSPETVASAPPVVGLNFPRVVNPANTAFSIFVYFSYRSSENPGAPPEKTLVGNASLYPADRPGGFRLRASGAFAKLKAAKATDVRLVVEIRRMHPAQPWQVEVSVEPPQWLGEK